MPQSQAAANPQHKEEGDKTTSNACKINKQILEKHKDQSEVISMLNRTKKNTRTLRTTLDSA